MPGLVCSCTIGTRVPVPIRSDSPSCDLSRLRIDRDARPRRPWLAWFIVAVLIAAAVAVYPTARALVDERRAPEVEVARATQITPAAGGTTALPVLVATGYVVARHSSDVGVKTGGPPPALQCVGGNPPPQDSVNAP